MERLLRAFAEHRIERFELREVRTRRGVRRVLAAYRSNAPLVHAFGHVEKGVLKPLRKSKVVDELLRNLVLQHINPRGTASSFTWPEERVAANIVYHRTKPLEIDLNELRAQLKQLVSARKRKGINVIR